MQDNILIAKVLIRSAKKKKLVIDTPDTEIMRVCSVINILLKYNWHLNSTNNKAIINLRLQNVKKY